METPCAQAALIWLETSPSKHLNNKSLSKHRHQTKRSASVDPNFICWKNKSTIFWSETPEMLRFAQACHAQLREESRMNYTAEILMSPCAVASLT